MIIIVETKKAPAFSSELIGNQIKYKILRKDAVTIMNIPWENKHRIRMTKTKTMNMTSAESDIAWFTDNPMAAWGKEKDKNNKDTTQNGSTARLSVNDAPRG